MANQNPSSGNRGNDARTGTTGGGSSGTTGNLQNAAGNAADRARDAARGVTESVRDSATGVMDRARDMAGSAADTARDWASSAASSVRDSDVVHKAEEYVSDAWESGSKYFQDHNFTDMAEDVAGIIRRNPIPAMLIGVGLGYILARSFRS